jgi:hypothetical protein
MPPSAALSDSCAAKWFRRKVGRAGRAGQERSDVGFTASRGGFGSGFTLWIGAWDYPISRAGYWAYTAAMPKVLHRMRQRQHEGKACSDWCTGLN